MTHVRSILFRLAARTGSFAFAALCLSSPALAASASGTVTVSLNITSACAINGGLISGGSFGSAGTIAFADQPGLFGDVDAALVASAGTGTNGLSILCSPGLTPSMAIGSGAHDSGNVRHLASGVNQVAYHLYSDPARTSEVGIGQQMSLGVASAAPLSFPLYARVNSAGAVLAQGSYSDTVQVTLSW